ncbi:unnamed protein product [Symbiodinium sp. KB8]|nr:unnamed protein product [Symbiodinium sp. KB8]
MPPTRRDVSGRSDAANLPVKMPLGADELLEWNWWISEDVQSKNQQANIKSNSSRISDGCSTAISSTPSSQSTQSEMPSKKSATCSSQVQSPYLTRDVRVPTVVELAAVPSAFILLFCFAFFQLAKWTRAPGSSMTPM